jgi:hypothetical protein
MFHETSPAKAPTFATCILEPAGAADLDNYTRGEHYRYERVPEKRVGTVIGHANGHIQDNSRVVQDEYYRVWPKAKGTPCQPCTPKNFHKYFSPTPTA